MWFAVRLVAHVWLLRFINHNCRSYCFYLFICLCEPTQTGAKHFFSKQPDISLWYDISSTTLSEPMSDIHTIFPYLFTVAFFMLLFHYLAQSLPRYASLVEKKFNLMITSTAIQMWPEVTSSDFISVLGLRLSEEYISFHVPFLRELY